MAEPIIFQSVTPRHGLPNLYSGQSQKEFFVNEAHARIDCLLHPAIELETSTPPTAPQEGQTWLVGAEAENEWEGQEGNLASWQSGSWIFVEPRIGLRVTDLSSGGTLYFDGAWQRLIAPSEPTGGAKADPEARLAIVNLIETLRIAGIFPST